MFDAARAGEEWQPEARKAQLHPGLLGRGGAGLTDGVMGGYHRGVRVKGNRD